MWVSFGSEIDLDLRLEGEKGSTASYNRTRDSLHMMDYIICTRSQPVLEFSVLVEVADVEALNQATCVQQVFEVV